MLSKIIGPWAIGTYFKRYQFLQRLWEDLEEDRSFLAALGRLLSPLSGADSRPDAAGLFPPRRPFEVPALRGKKIGLVATGGSGAMVSALGVVRACEEAGLEIAAISSCSGSAVALAPVAAGQRRSDQAFALLPVPGGVVELAVYRAPVVEHVGPRRIVAGVEVA